MSALEIGKKLVALCQKGDNATAIKELYDRDIVSIEAQSMPNMPAEMRGIDAVMAKHKWWTENMEVHSAKVEGPYPNADQFAVRFLYDTTNKQTRQRSTMDEIAVYTVKDGKIAREQFFYMT